MAELDAESAPVTGELISTFAGSYDPFESARFTALHVAAEIAKGAFRDGLDLDGRIDDVLGTADRIYAWLAQGIAARPSA